MDFLSTSLGIAFRISEKENKRLINENSNEISAQKTNHLQIWILSLQKICFLIHPYRMHLRQCHRVQRNNQLPCDRQCIPDSDTC